VKVKPGMRMTMPVAEIGIFCGIAVSLFAAAAVYWFGSYEDAGAVMLTLSGGLALLVGAYLWVTAQRARARGDHRDGQDRDTRQRDTRQRDIHHRDAHDEERDSSLYLPHASIWPFGVGIGAVVVANGLALGLWAVVLGMIIRGGSVLGYAGQSRRRD
jgi:hypothetical protein